MAAGIFWKDQRRDNRCIWLNNDWVVAVQTVYRYLKILVRDGNYRGDLNGIINNNGIKLRKGKCGWNRE